MKFSFYDKKYTCLDYRLGKILCETHLISEEEYNERYLDEKSIPYSLVGSEMFVYYQEDGSDFINIITSTYIEDEKPETIMGTLTNLLLSGFVDEQINFSNQIIEEFQSYIYETYNNEENNNSEEDMKGC
jgi:hypothetical protein